MEQKYFSNKITYMSFFLSICIFLIHTYNVDVYSPVTGTSAELIIFIEKFTHSLSEVAVPTFFCISGFLFYCNVTKEKLKNKLKRRIFSLCVPYIIWSIIGLIFFFVLSKIPKISSAMNGTMGTVSLSSIIKDILSSKFTFVLWFIRNLIIFTVLTAALYFIFPDVKVIIPLFAVSFFLPQLVPVFVNNKNIFLGYCYYLFGALSGLFISNAAEKRVSKSVSVFCLILSFVFSYVAIKIEIPEIPGCVFMIFRICLLWMSFDIFDLNTAPKRWQQLSFFTYVSHVFILESIEKVILIAFGKTVFGMTVDYFVSPILTFLIIVIISELLQKNEKLWKILTGGR